MLFTPTTSAGARPFTPGNRADRRRVRHQIRRGRRVAAVRAFGGAQLYLHRLAPTLTDAAVSSGSTDTYIRAAITVLQSEDVQLQARIVRGHVSLLAAAHRVKPLNNILRIYNGLDPETRRAFFNTAGCDRVLNDLAIAAG
jgi:hypothetical protein